MTDEDDCWQIRPEEMVKQAERKKMSIADKVILSIFGASVLTFTILGIFVWPDQAVLPPPIPWYGWIIGIVVIVGIVFSVWESLWRHGK